MRSLGKLSFLCFFLSSGVFAQTEISGYGAVGFRWYNRPAVRGYNNATYYEGKLQLDADITSDVSAQWDFRGYSDNSSVEFHEFSLALQYWKPIKVKIGNLRLPFGVEQMIEKEEMDMIERSYIHDQLVEMGYGGRSVSLMLQRKQKEEGKHAFPLSYYVMLYKNNSLSYGVVARIEKKFSEIELGSSCALQSYDGNCMALATSINVGYCPSSWSTMVELFLVEDPLEEKALKEMTGVLSTVYSLGIRHHTAIVFSVDGAVLKTIEPFYEIGAFVPNKEHPATHALQSVVGANFYLDPKVRCRIEGNILARKTRYDSSYSFHNSTVTLEVQVQL